MEKRHSKPDEKVDLGILEPGVITPGVVIAMNISFLLLEIVLLALSLYTLEMSVVMLLTVNFFLWIALNIMLMKMSYSEQIKKD